MKISILGARGSVPVSGKGNEIYGGATSSVLVQTDECAVYFDGGSGIINTPDIGKRRISIFLTHPHLDHILGLPFFPYFFEEHRKIDIYAGRFQDMSPEEQLDRVFSPPIWPCRIKDAAADIVFHEIGQDKEDRYEPVQIGDIHIEAIPSRHPGGAIIYKLVSDGKSFIYATDYEYDISYEKEIISFSSGADLMLIDAQYTDEEYENRRGYGHSSVSHGLRIMKEAGVKKMGFIHHDPRHDDGFIRDTEEKTKAIAEHTFFGRDGEEAEL